MNIRNLHLVDRLIGQEAILNCFQVLEQDLAGKEKAIGIG